MSYSEKDFNPNNQTIMSQAVLFIYSIVYKLYIFGIPLLPNIINKLFIRILFGCHIGTGAKIGKGCNLGYGGIGIVIHERTVIGNRVVISPGVTIGGTSNKYEVPVIGDCTFIATGAKVLGPIKIGRGCVIGANAVVVKDVPDNCLVMGIPGRIVKRDINVLEYKKL